jgi:hypothetical protein
MGRPKLWERQTEISPSTQYEDAMPLLGSAIVGGVHLLNDDLIDGLAIAKRLQALQMPSPVFAFSTKDVRHGQRQHDPSQVVGKRRPRETTHVLEDEPRRARLSDNTDCFGPHVSLILVPLMAAADREGLTRWPTCGESQAIILGPIDRANIFLMDGPMLDELDPKALVVRDVQHRVPIPLRHAQRLETSA